MTLSKFFIFLYSILSLQLFALLLAFLSLFFGFSGCISSLYITFSIGRKLDKLFRDRNIGYLPDIGWFSTVLRAQNYAMYIVSKNKMSRRRPYKDWYGDFDFYGSVSPLQRKACVLYFVFAPSSLILALITLSINKLTS